MAEAATILITGAAGFIGKALGQALLEKGHTVLGFDLVVPEEQLPFPIFAGDVRDAAALAKLCEGHGVDRIVHGGGVSGRSVARDDRTGTIDINVNGTTAALEAAIACRARKFVLCSTGSVYGRSHAKRIDEAKPLDPVNAYGASKVGAEAAMRAYHHGSGLDVVALRIFQAYGLNRRTRCTIATMLEAARTGGTAQFALGPQARLQYVYIADVVRALGAAILSDPLPELAYNIAGERTWTLAEAVEAAKRILPPFTTSFQSGPLTEEYTLQEIDGSAAQRDLGYAPEYDLSRGILSYMCHTGIRR